MLICSLLFSSKPYWLQKAYFNEKLLKNNFSLLVDLIFINILATLVRQEVGWVTLNLLLGKFSLFKQLAQLLMKWHIDKMFKHQASADFKVRSSYRFRIFSGWCN
jgi:hypothetical protein